MDNAPVALPIDGTLDLHTFAPSEIKTLVPDYLAACRERGILQVRIIHGKERGPEADGARAAREARGGGRLQHGVRGRRRLGSHSRQPAATARRLIDRRRACELPQGAPGGGV